MSTVIRMFVCAALLALVPPTPVRGGDVDAPAPPTLQGGPAGPTARTPGDRPARDASGSDKWHADARGPSWWRTAVVAGGLTGLMLLDEPLRDVYRRSRGEATDGVARIARPLGGPWTYVSVGTGLLAVGVASGDDEVLQAGARVGTSLIMAGVLTRAVKVAAGRERPAGGRGNHFFEPLSNKTSLPSGHAAMAFALATSLADEIDRPWASVALYTAATTTAWSRLNDDIHWTSDVMAGALLGRQCAKFIGRRLRFEHERAPILLPYEGGLAMVWTVRR